MRRLFLPRRVVRFFSRKKKTAKSSPRERGEKEGEGCYERSNFHFLKKGSREEKGKKDKDW